MSAVKVTTEPRAPFFTVNSLAAYLGLSTRTVREMLANGRLTSYRFEGARRIAAADVDAYVEARRGAPLRRREPS